MPQELEPREDAGPGCGCERHAAKEEVKLSRQGLEVSRLGGAVLRRLRRGARPERLFPRRIRAVTRMRLLTFVHLIICLLSPPRVVITVKGVEIQGGLVAHRFAGW